jgi:Transposase DDE domain group 1
VQSLNHRRASPEAPCPSGRHGQSLRTRASADCNQRGTAEQWIKEDKEATHWTRLLCYRFRANEVQFLLDLIAYSLGNLLRRLGLPVTVQNCSLTSAQQRLFKTGGRLSRHAQYFVLRLADGRLTRRLFRQILATSSALRGTRYEIWNTGPGAGQ